MGIASVVRESAGKIDWCVYGKDRTARWPCDRYNRWIVDRSRGAISHHCQIGNKIQRIEVDSEIRISRSHNSAVGLRCNSSCRRVRSEGGSNYAIATKGSIGGAVRVITAHSQNKDPGGIQTVPSYKDFPVGLQCECIRDVAVGTISCPHHYAITIEAGVE